MTLEQRVEKLERQNRWFKRGAAPSRLWARQKLSPDVGSAAT
jgi:hypothetical protein